jgi:hypothetical protein
MARRRRTFMDESKGEAPRLAHEGAKVGEGGS